MSHHIPLIERCELIRGEESDTPRVWYRVTSPADVELLQYELVAGDWVTILARVNSVRSSGGYETGALPPGRKEQLAIEKRPVELGLELRFEQSEIYVIRAKKRERKRKP